MTVAQLHNKALGLADQAFSQKRKAPKKAIKLFKEAFEFEKKAALIAETENVSEVTLSVLLKSAASLALNAELPREAEKLICLALSGEPPYEIGEELRNLLEEVNFARHLKLQGIELENTDLQFVISGNGVSYGMVKRDALFDRIETFEKLTLRTIERKLNKPFREKGNISDDIRDLYTSYYSVPRAASFAITVRIGKSKKQIEIGGLEKSKDIIDDIMGNIELINDGKEDEVRKVIKEEAYFRNFIHLTKELAPDGKDISLVGFTVNRGGKEKQVQFTRKRSEFDISSVIRSGKNTDKAISNRKTIEITGLLSAADIDQHKLRLKNLHGKNVHVKVPEGMGDIVRKYFESNVTIKAVHLSANTVELLSIDSANSE